MSDDDSTREKAVSIVSILVLGAGFVAMFAGVSWFWAVWVVGFAVVVPVLSILLGTDDDEEWVPRSALDAEAEEDPLEVLRERYARGELTEAQFERKVETLLETESIEDVEDAHAAEGDVERAERRPERER